jgi:phosphoenolpyruvate-protein kinase (PTS system EI component)
MEIDSCCPLYVALSGDTPSLEIVKAVEGVGLIRSEYVMRKSGEYVMTDAGSRFLGDYVKSIANLFDPKPVWIRTSDFEEREISTLSGAIETLPSQDNPILGARGVRRGQLLNKPFEQEIAVYAEVGRHANNLGLLFSYVADAVALDFAISTARSKGWRGSIGTMIEIPSAALEINDILEREIELIVIGLNDLSTLVLGAERSAVHNRKDHPAVVQLIEHVCNAAQRKGVKVLIAGNFRQDEFVALRHLSKDGIIVHHYEMPKMLPELAVSYQDLDVVPLVKAETLRRLRSLNDANS